MTQLNRILPELSSYRTSNPNTPRSSRISPTDIVPTVTSNTPVTGVPSVVSGIVTRGDELGVGVGVGVALALALPDGLALAFALAEGEGLALARVLPDGDGLAEGETEAAADGLGEAEVVPGA
jgi:hypothetical protein